MECIAVILAGGRGSRMALKTSKVLAPICHKPVLSYIFDELKNIDFYQKFVVLGANSQEIAPLLPSDTQIVIQPTPRGTGDAFACACKKFADFDGRVLLINGDGPIVSSDAIKQILYLNDAKMSIFTGILPQNQHFGRIKRRFGKIVDIVEARDCGVKDLKIAEKNLGIYCFDNQTLQKYIYNLTCDNAQNEYYVTDLVKIFAQNHHKITSFVKNNADFYLPSTNTLSELCESQRIMQNIINARHIGSGVNIICPNNTCIDAYSEIGKFTTIYANCTIIGSKIGQNCTIYPNCVIKNAILADNLVIGSNSVIDGAQIAKSIAPLSYIKDKK